MSKKYYHPLNRHESKLSGWPDDPNGNLTSKTDGTDTYTYSWSEDNQLVGVELNSSPVVSYEYDSGSRMLQRIEGSISTNYHWDGWDLVREEKDDGVDVEITNYLVPQGEVLAFQRDGDWFYLHGDGLSSTQLVTDENGAQVGRAVYGAWGETLSSNETIPGLMETRFVGGLGVRNDAATGLIWMRHRWYDPTTQRFISRDPIGHTGGSNSYAYCNNRPNDYLDSLGLKPAADVYNDIYNDYAYRFEKLPGHENAFLYPGDGKGGLSLFCHMLRRASKSVDSNKDFLDIMQSLHIPDSAIAGFHFPLAKSKFQGSNFALSPGVPGLHESWQEGDKDQYHHLVAFIVSGYGHSNTPSVSTMKSDLLERYDSWKRGVRFNVEDARLGDIGSDYGSLLQWNESRCGDGRKWPSQRAYRKHWIDALCYRLGKQSTYR